MSLAFGSLFLVVTGLRCGTRPQVQIAFKIPVVATPDLLGSQLWGLGRRVPGVEDRLPPRQEEAEQ